MGYLSKYVQKLLKEFAELKDSPVRVVRRRRNDAEGFRTSDEYALEILKPEPNGTLCSSRPEEAYRNKAPSLAEQNAQPNGTERSALSDLSRSDQSDLYSASRGKVTKRVPVKEAPELLAFYKTEFQRLRKADPHFTKLMSKALAAFADLFEAPPLPT